MHLFSLGLSHPSSGLSYANHGLRVMVASLLMLITSSVSAQFPAEIEPIKAPFDMPQLQRPVFPARKTVIRKSSDIQPAIDKLSRKGGGTVVVPKGKWHTGRIVLKSNVCLQVSEGAELCFSGDLKDYLPVFAYTYGAVHDSAVVSASITSVSFFASAFACGCVCSFPAFAFVPSFA